MAYNADEADLAEKWHKLHLAGFKWGREKPKVYPNDYGAFPPQWIPDTSMIADCWIKHESWTFAINVKIKRRLGETPLDIQWKWFNIFDKVTHLRDMDMIDIVRYLKGVKHV